MKRSRLLLIAFALVFFSISGQAANDCVFDDDPVTKTLTLTADCTTDSTIFVPDGYTLDGNQFQITAIDPPSGHFLGAVVQNAGATAHVKNLGVTASALSNVCNTGPDRLRGIMFEGASGSVTGNNVIGINQGVSGCQEGNAIEIRNAPFDGTHPNTVNVDINNNYVDAYQKTGIVVNGDAEASVTNNYVGSADLEDSLAANSVQFGFGAFGSVNNNQILGNEWDGLSNFAATAVLIFLAGDVNVNHNTIAGDATDVGVLAVFAKTVNVMNNTITRSITVDEEKDDFGVAVWFFDNDGKSKVVRNEVSGWNSDFLGADLDVANVVQP